MVACRLITSFLILFFQVSIILSKEDDGIVITLHRNEESNLHARVVQEDQKYQRLARIVETSKNRAQALKNWMHRRRRVGKIEENENVVESLYAHSYGGYSIKFSMGTPPQDLSLLVDTGSDLVWVPCTRNYSCFNCPAQSANSSNGIFLPMMSSSSERGTCGDPYCRALHNKPTEVLCGNCSRISGKNCSQINCPDYLYRYGVGRTGGVLGSETLTLPLEDKKRAIRHFAVGCSIISAYQPPGVVGFGRGALSMISQLSDQHIIGKDMFAYCFQSHLFDEENNTSVMVLGEKALRNDIPLNYTPFLVNSLEPTFYYIGLIGVSIGGKRLKLPSKFFRFDTNGKGGTIIDSGTTFTAFHQEIYEKIAAGFASRIEYRRASEFEKRTGFGLCYNISGVENVVLPEFVFHLNDGLDMVLPVANYFSYFGSSICLTMGSLEGLPDGGPAVILGNYQQQNFYILYDREKNRLGFSQQTCQTYG